MDHRYPEIKRLREDEGLIWREVGARLGISFKMANQIYYDPDGIRARARKAKNDGVCRDCGARTSSSGAKIAPERCADCEPKHRRKLSKEWVLDSIREWADENGGVPPAALDWNPALADAYGHHERAERFRAAQGRWPNVSLAQKCFGSWNAAIEAAGFEPRRSGHYGRDGEDPAAVARTIALYESGLSCAQVGALMGIGESGVWHRLAVAGVPRRSLREAQQLRRAA